MNNKNFFPMGIQSVQKPQPANCMNGPKRLAGKFGIALWSAILGVQTGCILPGQHGGPPGLPGLPGLPGPPRVELPNPLEVVAATTVGEDLARNGSPQFVQNEKSVNAINAKGESYE